MEEKKACSEEKGAAALEACPTQHGAAGHRRPGESEAYLSAYLPIYLLSIYLPIYTYLSIYLCIQPGHPRGGGRLR